MEGKGRTEGRWGGGGLDGKGKRRREGWEEGRSGIEDRMEMNGRTEREDNAPEKDKSGLEKIQCEN